MTMTEQVLFYIATICNFVVVFYIGDKIVSFVKTRLRRFFKAYSRTNKKESVIMRIISIDDLVKVGELDAKIQDYSEEDNEAIAKDLFKAITNLLNPEEGDNFELRIEVMKKRTLGKAKPVGFH